MTIKKFITYECNTCKRSKDLAVDLIHGFVDKCTITKNCTGRLFPIKAKNLRDILPSKGAAGLQNWTPRGNLTEAERLVNKPVSYDLASSGNRTLTLISKVPFSTAPSTYLISFIAQLDTVQDYIEFDYTLASGSKTIIGKDSTGKTLRFSQTDLLNVYVQGVLRPQLDPILGYTLNYQNGVGYSIDFNTTQAFATSVKVVVFQGVTLTETAQLEFIKNSELAVDGAWSNIETVSLHGETWTVYTCIDTSALPVNSQLNLYEVVPDPVKSHLEDFYFLMAYSPYSVIDRVYSIGVHLSNLNLPNQYVSVNSVNGVKTINVSSESLSELTNLQLKQIKNTSAEVLTSAPISMAEPIKLETSIIGPI